MSNRPGEVHRLTGVVLASRGRVFAVVQSVVGTEETAAPADIFVQLQLNISSICGVPMIAKRGNTESMAGSGLPRTFSACSRAPLVPV